ncbi:MAG: BamA/TamA family outer membrane protein [Acidobacteria bacterium]|nr:BamA/TamA family outer membrane protein [Acidobacteriota bacterium]
MVLARSIDALAQRRKRSFAQQPRPERPALIAVLLVGIVLHVPDLGAAEPLRIGSITVITEDVYTAEEAKAGSAYAIVNSLHIRTRESIVRRLLLFREGDEYVDSRLAESERNLRTLGFISSARVTAGEPHDGVVDVTVVTQDSWSTEPGGTVGSAGGGTDASFEIREANLLGLGKEFTIGYSTDPDRSGFGVRYEDPAMFGRYWSGDLLYAENSDGRRTRLLVDRPFFSFATKWSIRALIDDETLGSRIYMGGAIASEFRESRANLEIEAGRALVASDARAHRLNFGIDFESREFAPLPEGGTSALPTDREYRYFVAEYEYAQNLYRKVDFVERDARVEDYRLGTQLRVRAGVSPAFLGIEETTGILSVSMNRGWVLPGDAMILGGFSWESRLGARNRNEILGLDLRFIRRSGDEHPRALVGRASLRRGRDLDAETQFFADGDTGLRGYRLHSFSGDSSLLLNLEQRVFLGRELWQVVSPGVAVFVDAGNAANGSHAFDLSKLHWDAGVGLRIGASRSPRSMFRLDFAYAVDPDPLGRDGWLISFSGSQAF